MKKNINITALIVICTVCFLGGFLIIFFSGSLLIKNIPSAQKNTTESTSAKKKAATTEVSTNDTSHPLQNASSPVATENKDTSEISSTIPEPTQPPAETTLVQPQLLVDTLQNYKNYTTNNLNNIIDENGKSHNCQQIILVNSTGNMADISFFEKKENNLWQQNTELDTTGFVGQLGVSEHSYEGSIQTPAGLFSIGKAFYLYDVPKTDLDKFQITETTEWVDDPTSGYYNQLVDSSQISSSNWTSSEKMYFIPSYKYGFVINYNMGTNKYWEEDGKGKGSAIFFHCSETPTLGCVGVSEEKMLDYLAVLDEKKNPYILIQ